MRLARHRGWHKCEWANGFGARMSVSYRPALAPLLAQSAWRLAEFDGQGIANLGQAMAKTQVVQDKMGEISGLGSLGFRA